MNSSPALPTSHPFSNIQSATDTFYWSATTDANGVGAAWVVRFEGGESLILGKDSVLFVWCARGGMTADAY